MQFMRSGLSVLFTPLMFLLISCILLCILLVLSLCFALLVDGCSDPSIFPPCINKCLGRLP